MSRFSKAAAEKAGWSFFHESDEVVLNDGNNEAGVSRVVPASVRAEKYVDLPGKEATLVTEEAGTIGKLLERIHLYEQHLASRVQALEPDARIPDEDPADSEGKQVAKQNAESERVAAADKAEDLSPAEPGAEDEDLDSLSHAQLKSIAKEKGIKPLPRRKAKLIAAIKAAK